MTKFLIGICFAFMAISQTPLMANQYQARSGIVILDSERQSQIEASPNAQKLTSRGINVDCEEEAKKAVSQILKITEARALIETVQESGPIHVKVERNALSNQFGAFWDAENRVICINGQSSEGQKIGSILFELHNALNDYKFRYLDHLAHEKIIDRNTYVKAVEHVEYENSHMAARIANKGIEQGIFPSDAYLPTYRDFEEHFRYQKIGGHSAWIEKNYNLLF